MRPTPQVWLVRVLPLFLFLFLGVAVLGCANQTTIHTTPLGAKVYINGALCGESPCVHHTRYGFPDRMRVQLETDGYHPAEFFLDTEPPLASYLLFGFGSYLFHTYPENYRFTLRPLPRPPAALEAPPPPSNTMPTPTLPPPTIR